MVPLPMVRKTKGVAKVLYVPRLERRLYEGNTDLPAISEPGYCRDWIWPIRGI